MRALQLESYEGPSGLRMVDIPEPEPDGASLLVDVRAVGINFPDLLLTKGQYQDRPELPAVPGCEVAGVVLEAPDGSAWSPGDRVAAWIRQGGFAERALVTPRTAAAIPDGADFETAAAMVVNYHTVHFALRRRGRVVAGESVLVLGAGGGIGSAAVQVAKGLGAHVIGGVANEEQVATALAAGADHTLVLGEGFSTAVKELTNGHGVDAVLDPLGGWLTGEALRALAPEGRLLIVGFAAGGIPELKANRLLLRNVSAVGVAWGAFLDIDPGVMSSAADSLAEMYHRGAVRPPIGQRFSLERIPEALELLDRGKISGKAVAVLG